jgi:hypothetical protein
VSGLSGYVDPIGVQPGEVLRVHLTAPAAHRISIARLGLNALLDDAGDAADRAEATVLGLLERPSASRHAIYPGSYASVDEALAGRPAAISGWVRPWRLPSVVETWSWSAVVGEFDFPHRCHWGLGFDASGHPACYIGDGNTHDREWWTFAEASVVDRLGDWIHLAYSVDGPSVRLYMDGIPIAERRNTPPSSPSAPGCVRIAAAAEGGVTDFFLDGDLSAITLFGRPLRREEVARLAADRGLSAPSALGLDEIEAHWPLRETSGARLADTSGHERHAVLFNGASLGIPGPSASTAIGRRGYDPKQDRMRGGAVRFACDDLVDCHWPCAAEVRVPVDADSGMYYARVALEGSDDALELPFAIVRPTPRRGGSIALLIPTFTWTAYARRPIDDVVVPGLTSSFYSTHLGGRQFFHLGMRMPLLPRVRPFVHRTHRRGATFHQHLVRPERLAEAWLAREGYPYECITDAELDREPGLLKRFAALMIVGHNEYWSQRMRDGVEAYLDAGGAALNLSGNTLFWRVTYDDERRTLEARKTTDPGETDTWLQPSEWGERWHTDGQPGGKWSLIGQPTSELLGLETLGWIDGGDPTGFAPFTVRTPDHFLFREPRPVPLEAGGLLGTRSLNGAAVSGYEMDGLPAAVGMAPRHSTAGMTLLAHAQHGQRYVATFAEDPGYGADMIYWERPSGGRLFNAASIGYTGSLAVDPGIQVLTRNVLHHFGVVRQAVP